jgi:hypothetical protein
MRLAFPFSCTSSVFALALGQAFSLHFLRNGPSKWPSPFLLRQGSASFDTPIRRYPFVLVSFVGIWEVYIRLGYGGGGVLVFGLRARKCLRSVTAAECILLVGGWRDDCERYGDEMR